MAEDVRKKKGTFTAQQLFLVFVETLHHQCVEPIWL